MNAMTAGLIGAATTNVLHETVRRTLPKAPRVDLLGMQALSKMISPVAKPPRGKALYGATLAGDLISNSAYFSAVGFAPRAYVVPVGVLVGTLAGVGAVALPGPLGLDEETTSRSTPTMLLTIALYAAGGLATGLALRASASSEDETVTNPSSQTTSTMAAQAGTAPSGVSADRRSPDAAPTSGDDPSASTNESADADVVRGNAGVDARGLVD